MESSKRNEAQRSAIESETVEVSGSSRSREDETTNAGVEDVLLSTPLTYKKIRPSVIISPELAYALDQTKINDRNETYVLTANTQSLGHNPSEIALNKKSIRQSRRHRDTIAAKIRTLSTDIPLPVHWDGKMLPSLSSSETVC